MFEPLTQFRHRAFGIPFHYKGFETGKGKYQFLDLTEWYIRTEIFLCKEFPEPDSQAFGHMKRLFDEFLLTQIAAQVDHTQVKEMVSPAEITQIYEVPLIAYKNCIAVLEVAVYGSVLIRDIGNKTLQFFFLGRRKKRIIIQEPVIAVFYPRTALQEAGEEPEQPGEVRG